MTEILISFVLAILAVLIFLGAWTIRGRINPSGLQFWLALIPVAAVILVAFVLVIRLGGLYATGASDPVTERAAFGAVALAVLLFIVLAVVSRCPTAAVHRNKPTAVPPVKASTARIFNEPEELPAHPVTAPSAKVESKSEPKTKSFDGDYPRYHPLA